MNRDIRGEAILEVVAAFTVSRPEFAQWLQGELAATAGKLSRKQLRVTLGKLDAEISEVQGEHNARRIRAAQAAVEREILAEVTA